MNPTSTFWISFLLLFALIVFCDRKYGMLKDASLGNPRPYSFSRSQLAWWTMIVFASIIAIMVSTGTAPTLDSSTLVLMGISAGTTTVARLIDQSDQSETDLTSNQNIAGQNFFLDILSDKNGISIHRLQSVILNIVFGVWMIKTVCFNLGHVVEPVIPVISNNNLILIGLSSGTYAALKTTENKQPAITDKSVQSDLVADEAILVSTPSVG